MFVFLESFIEEKQEPCGLLSRTLMVQEDQVHLDFVISVVLNTKFPRLFQFKVSIIVKTMF